MAISLRYRPFYLYIDIIIKICYNDIIEIDH